MVGNHGRQMSTCRNGALKILTEIERDAAAGFAESRILADAIRENSNFIPV